MITNMFDLVTIDLEEYGGVEKLIMGDEPDRLRDADGRKLALTFEKLEVEHEEEEADITRAMEVDDDDEEEQQRCYNPLKLPMGFDEKPIPYWLYKLQGLRQEFT
ncbi:hypothetical protein RJ639_013596 [Escallonia herrerae]|uniref:Splicing factor SF3a60 /Prp9 subunit C-terminal domain-containing protein n=1 Tax=Escallonia herrerae TaxID=1293975 RepID=A0AA88VK13_9ASTE|nr:hypothetical protein RJ639_013596 [Escallonia herrerae]